MARVWIDGQEHEADPSRNMLEVALRLRKDLPYFCWHPALGSVGACRQCAVKQFKDEKDTRGRIVMSCMTPATEGTRISIDDPEAAAFRASIIEWLMVNHPHDCPVCDEGGECHLQDMTEMTGHVYRRHRFRKRTYVNQNLGPFVNHEMNRCIQCYRCVRYYREYAGGEDFQVFGVHDDVYFGRAEDGPLESPFSGNLVEVCPTGVFTDKSFKRHYTRKWDLRTAPSICVHCGLGCNTIPAERYGSLRRIRNHYNGAVNGYFLCDRGRYGYEFVNHPRRIREPLLPRGPRERAEAPGRERVLAMLAPLVKERTRMIGIGSPRASLESNFALRALVGSERFYQGIPRREHALLEGVLGALASLRGGLRVLTLREIEQCDAVLVLGEDVSNTAPRCDLALRQAIRQEPMEIARRFKIPLWDDAAVREAMQEHLGPLFLATPVATLLDGKARRVLHAPPEEIARLGRAVARALDGGSPEIPGLEPSTRDLAREIASTLKAARCPAIISGTGCGSLEVIRAAAQAARALDQARPQKPSGIFLTVPECNSIGVALLGGDPLESAIQAVKSGGADTVIVLENDLYRRLDASVIDPFLDSVRHLVIIDHLAHATAARGEAVLPAGTFAESDGTLINNELRAQRFFQVFQPEEGETQESWRWIRDLGRAAGRLEMELWVSLDNLIHAIEETLPHLRGVREAAPPSVYRLAGSQIPRAPHRFSGRTAMHAHLGVREPRPPDDPDTFYSFTMEGYQGEPPAKWMPRIWAPGWNSIQALNRFQEEIAGPLLGGDPGVRLHLPDGPQEPEEPSPPPPFRAEPNRWRLIPLHHVFGSEELSALSPGVAALAPPPYLALNESEALKLGVVAGEAIELSWDEEPPGTLRLPLRIRPDLPEGTAGWPVGLCGLLLGALPDWGRVRRP